MFRFYPKPVPQCSTHPCDSLLEQEVVCDEKLADFDFFLGIFITLVSIYLFWLFRALYRIFRHWRIVKSIQNGYPVTDYSVKTKESKCEYTEWRNDGQVGVTATDLPVSSGGYLMFIQEFVQLLYPGENKLIPLGTINVSVAQKNFKVGTGPQEFIPIDHEIPSNAYFTYQLVTSNVQLTFYNENGTSFLAGFTFYPTLEDQIIPYLHTEDQAIRYALMIAEPFPKQTRGRNLNYQRFKKYGRQCSMAGKRVVVFAEEGKPAVHYEYDFLHRKKTLVKCEECAADFKNYKFEEVETSGSDALPTSKTETNSLINFTVETKDEFKH